MTLEVVVRHGGPPLDLDLALPRSRIVAIVGPSGSGKTSLLRAIAGLPWSRSQSRPGVRG